MRTSPMARATVLVAAVALSIAGWLSPAVPGPAEAATALTAFYVDGGWMAPARASYQTTPASTFTATYESTNRTASVDIDTAGDDSKTWRLKFQAPPGEQLGVGAYPNAVRWPSSGAGQPGFSLVRLYQGCNEESGEFTISDWQVSGSTITSFAVSFEHQCEAGIFGTSRGELRFSSTVSLKAVLPYVGSIDFGVGVTGRATASKTLTVAARGNEAATISTVALGGDYPGDYQIASNACTGATLAPGSTCDIKVKLTAKAIGTRGATLVVSDDTFPGAHVVALAGGGRPYAVTPASLDFGTQQLLTRGRATVTFVNGLDPVDVISLDVQGSSEGYAIAPGSGCGTIAALGTCNVVVEFTPTTIGSHDFSSVSWTVVWKGSYDYPQTPLKGVGVKTSNVAWGTDRTAGRNYTWSYGKALGRTVSGTTTYLHVIEATNNVGGKWATDSGPYVGAYYVRSANAGSTWTTSRRLNPSTQHAERTALTASGANVYAAWVSQTKWVKYSPTAPRVLYVRTNTNHGSTTAWRSTVRVSSSTGRVDYPAIAASGSNVYVTYTDANTGNIRLAISRDRGATWTYKTIGTTSQSTSDGKAGYPAVAVSGTRVIVSWTLDNDFKIVARSSVDSGANWAAQATIAMTAGSESVAAASAERFAVAWTDADGARVRSHAAGAWGAIKSIKISGTNPYGAHWTPAVAFNGTVGTAVSWGACYASCDEAGSTVDLIWAESSDGGITFPHLQVLAANDAGINWSPSIVWAKADARHVLYERDTEGGYRLRIRTGTGAPK